MEGYEFGFGRTLEKFEDYTVSFSPLTVCLCLQTESLIKL